MRFYYGEPIGRRRTDRWMFILMLANVAALIIIAMQHAPCADLIERFDAVVDSMERSRRSLEDRAHGL